MIQNEAQLNLPKTTNNTMHKSAVSQKCARTGKTLKQTQSYAKPAWSIKYN